MPLARPCIAPMFPAPDPEALAAQAQRVHAGDHSAFTELVRATSPALFRVCARILADRDAAADVLQDTYLRAFEALRRGDFAGRAGVLTWLYRIATNASIDALRRRRVRMRPPPPPSPGPYPTDHLDARIALTELADLLADLPHDQRAVLVLKELEGLTSAEIAGILGISEGAVEQRLLRARTNLKKKRSRNDAPR